MLQKECFTRDKDVWPKCGTKLNSRKGNIKISRQFHYQEEAQYSLMCPKEVSTPKSSKY